VIPPETCGAALCVCKRQIGEPIFHKTGGMASIPVKTWIEVHPDPNEGCRFNCDSVVRACFPDFLRSQASRRRGHLCTGEDKGEALPTFNGPYVSCQPRSQRKCDRAGTFTERRSLVVDLPHFEIYENLIVLLPDCGDRAAGRQGATPQQGALESEVYVDYPRQAVISQPRSKHRVHVGVRQGSHDEGARETFVTADFVVHMVAGELIISGSKAIPVVKGAFAIPCRNRVSGLELCRVDAHSYLT
jgi:hypothetical protein